MNLGNLALRRLVTGAKWRGGSRILHPHPRNRGAATAPGGMTTGSSPSGLPPTPALASPNQTGLSVGSISGISKKGWEYLWGEGGGG